MNPSISSQARLAIVAELQSQSFTSFMAMLNALAAQWQLRQMTNWSKVWEYPWIWHRLLSHIHWPGKHLVDFGSELSPVPWFLATLGAKITLIESDPQFIPLWQKLRDQLRVDVQWQIVTAEHTDLPNNTADVITSFSVIEHQRNHFAAAAELVRLLKPGGYLGISFDICQPEMGMTFPEWNGRAFTLAEFEQTLWTNPAFGNQAIQQWNMQDIAAFKQWHLQSAPHHNYVVGAAVLIRNNSVNFFAPVGATDCSHG
jgi:2-polyprenyl-3-methyl-5-hydroxy-6-metoxy-1,4-benzoquinol methylase